MIESGADHVGSLRVDADRSLRVVVWNMAHKAGAWAALDELNPDIALLNEAMVPGDRTGVWSSEGTIGRDGKRRPWTAAVISRYPTTPITDARPEWRGHERNVPFECSRPGSWVAARVETPFGAVTAVALYGLLDELSDDSLHRSLSELSPVTHDPRYRKQIVLGGDLNTFTQWKQPEADLNARDQGVLDRIEAHGLSDCIRAKRQPGRLQDCPCLHGEACVHVRTQRRAQQPHVPFQTDYLFASTKLMPALVSCVVLATEKMFSISDHAPIVAEFRFPIDAWR